MLADVQAVRRYIASVAEAPTPHAGVMRAEVEAAVAQADGVGTRATEPLPVPKIDAIEASALQTPTVAPPRPHRPPSRVETPAVLPDARDADDFAETTRYPEPDDAPTRRLPQVDQSTAPSGPRGTPRDGARPASEPTAPGFAKKTSGASGFAAGGYAPARTGAPDSSGWEDDETTGVVEPAVEAELLLQQGFAQRALETYRFLALKAPGDARVARRIVEIESMITLERTPMPGEQTVRRDVSHLQHVARPTARLNVPEDVRVSVQIVGRGTAARSDRASASEPASTKDVRIARVVIVR
jgi:hypothetical protein